MSELLKKTVKLAGTYVAKNEIAPNDVSRLIIDIFGALRSIAGEEEEEAASDLLPAVAQPPVMPPPVPAPPRKGRPRKVVAPVISPPTSPDAMVVPIIAIEDAVTDDEVFCLICGKGCRALKGHIDRIHNMDLDTYRRKFGLERDFPLVAPSYSEKRRQLALDSGLGDRSRRQLKEA